MAREIPSLDWLRVYAATAETESFAMAAARLGVTPGAVSQRIRSLEAFLGVSLFHRHAQGVTLTEEGKRYAQRVLPPLGQLATATREFMAAKDTRSVRITSLPALAQLWLGARMADFHKRHPDTTVEISADATVIDLHTSRFDLAIRYGNPPFPGCDHHDFLDDQLVPVASPALLEKVGTDMQGFPRGASLLLDTYWNNDLNAWLAATGQSQPQTLTTQTFSLYSMVIDATLQGRGFTIGHTSLVDDMIREGKLKALSSKRVNANARFYLLTKAATPLPEPVETIIEWLLQQAGCYVE